MRPISSKLPDEIVDYTGCAQKKSHRSLTIASKKAYPVNNYSELVKITARLSYMNKDYLLFYRGQKQDYINRYGRSTFYPSIYRDDSIQQHEVKYRFDVLNGACKILKELFTERNVEGSDELKRKKYVQWSILQHYEVCPTPLFDISHSLRVACSFALQDNPNKEAYIYLFGLPYITNRITINSEHDLVAIRLLSICPPDALRPYFQEGYLAGTEDIKYDYERKDELDFARRLIAKFVIPNNDRFWGHGFQQIPADSLCPTNDPIFSLCKEIKENTNRDLKTGNLGEFLLLWSDLEGALNNKSKQISQRFLSVPSAINLLFKNKYISDEEMLEIDSLRKFRNAVVHSPKKIEPDEIKQRIKQLKLLKTDLKLSKKE